MRNKRKATRQGKPGRFSFENEHHFSSYSASTATRSSIHREIFSMISSPAIAADNSAAHADSADHADHADHSADLAPLSADLAALAVDPSPAIAADNSAALAAASAEHDSPNDHST